MTMLGCAMGLASAVQSTTDQPGATNASVEAYAGYVVVALLAAVVGFVVLIYVRANARGKGPGRASSVQGPAHGVGRPGARAS